MMAIHTSNVDPRPHEIATVCEAMLPEQPLRFALADDEGHELQRQGGPRCSNTFI